MRQQTTLREDKFSNALSSILLLSGIFLLLGFMGASFLGRQGLLLAPLVLVSVLLFEYLTPADWLFRLHKAHRFPRDHALHDLFLSVRQQFELDDHVQLYYSRVNMFNALTVGVGPNAAIILTLPLIERFSGKELEGVLAHEMAHVKNHDLRFMNIAQVATRLVSDLSSFIVLFAILFMPFSFLSGFPGVSLMAFLLALIAPWLAVLMQMKLSRTREFSADLDAADKLGDPGGLISALIKLESWQSGNPFFSLFKRRTHPLHSHPETEERVERLRSYGARAA